MSMLTKSKDNCRAVADAARQSATRLKQAGVLGEAMDVGSFGGVDNWRKQAQNRERYGHFRDWLYSVVNKIAMTAAGQPVNIGRLAGAEPEEQRSRPSSAKQYHLEKMPYFVKQKLVGAELEVLIEHRIKDVIASPNNYQAQWQFVYLFVVNLLLTGRSYVVWEDGKDGLILYSLPTTWVRPNADFTEFRLVDPSKSEVSQDTKPLTRDQVAVATLPEPGSPKNAMAPAASQMSALQINDYIQEGREQFFQQGVFPSMIITIGKGEEGVRPRLNPTQRRQIEAVISKNMASVYRQGKPAIVDGLVEKIERLSATSQEMGWKESEQIVKQQILSAFGVHPFILGEAVNVGGHAQTVSIKELFYNTVNTYLSMLSTLMTRVANVVEPGDKMVVWWENLIAIDPALASREWMEARKLDDISRNENRARLGLPPIDDEKSDRNKLLESVGGFNSAMTALGNIKLGQADPASVAKLFHLFLGIPITQAEDIVGSGSPAVLENAIDQLEAAMLSLQPKRIAGYLTDG